MRKICLFLLPFIILPVFYVFSGCDSGATNQPLENVSATIGSAGGVLNSDSGTWDLLVPAGALVSDTEIVLSTWPDTSVEIPEGYSSVIPPFRFSPHGTEFEADCTLTITYSQGDMPEGGIEERLIAFYYIKEDGILEKAESTLDMAANQLVVSLPHFSIGAGLTVTIWLVNNGAITNETVVQMIADAVADELAAMSPEERQVFYEDNIDLLGPFSDKLDEILPSNPVAETVDAVKTYYQDLDVDGFGNPSVSVVADSPPTGYVLDNTDCDDTQGTVYPGNTESCDNEDNDCDGMVDEDFYYYTDSDGDGYGASTATGIKYCSNPPSSMVKNNDDCDDGQAVSYPGNAEVCDGYDNNCDGQVDEGLLKYFYEDRDGDGYGSDVYRTDQMYCTAPPGYYDAIPGDCDDTQAVSYPGNTEVCDGYDNDCDGQVDEGLLKYFYQDPDSDGYGHEMYRTDQMYCMAPSGYHSALEGDCDPHQGLINPGVAEIPGNGVDENCDGIIE